MYTISFRAKFHRHVKFFGEFWLFPMFATGSAILILLCILLPFTSPQQAIGLLGVALVSAFVNGFILLHYRRTNRLHWRRLRATFGHLWSIPITSASFVLLFYTVSLLTSRPFAIPFVAERCLLMTISFLGWLYLVKRANRRVLRTRP